MKPGFPVEHGEPTEVAAQLEVYRQWLTCEGPYQWSLRGRPEPPYTEEEAGQLVQRAVRLLRLFDVKLERKETKDV